MPHPFALRSEVTGDVARVVVTGDVDTATAPALRSGLIAAVDSGAAAVIADLSGVVFFASSGINALLAVRRHARVPGVDLAVVAAHRVVLRPLTVTGAAAVLGVHPTVPDALAALRPDPRRLPGAGTGSPA
jgi:anti-anti-sigma factor